MGQIKVEKNVGGIDGLCIIEPIVHGDARGYFMETYNQKDMQDSGLNMIFVQDNQSCSSKGVLRGLHFQRPPYTQGKFVRCTKGKVYDVVVDIRKNSSTYGKWIGVELSPENNRQLLVPRGFLHGFQTLTDDVIFSYKCDNFYNKESDGGVAYDDPDLGIVWPIEEKVLSEKDKNHPILKELIEKEGDIF